MHFKLLFYLFVIWRSTVNQIYQNLQLLIVTLYRIVIVHVHLIPTNRKIVIFFLLFTKEYLSIICQNVILLPKFVPFTVYLISDISRWTTVFPIFWQQNPIFGWNNCVRMPGELFSSSPLYNLAKIFQLSGCLTNLGDSTIWLLNLLQEIYTNPCCPCNKEKIRVQGNREWEH